MLVWALAVLPGMDSIAKILSGHLPILEIVSARYVFFALSVVPVAWRYHGLSACVPTRPGLQLVRGALLAISALTFFCAIARMPLADALAIYFIYPFMILVISQLCLGEKIRRRQWLLVALGFCGALLIAQPSAAGISPGAPFALTSGVAYAAALIITRRVAPHDPPLVTTAISALVGALIYLCFLPFVWQAPRRDDWALMAAMGVIAAIGHLLVAAAHRRASASHLAPYGYLEIISAVLCGLLLFGDWPKPVVWTGIVLIVASGMGATWRGSDGQGR